MNKKTLKKFVEGNEEAFNVVYEEYYPTMKKICYYYTRDRFLSEDLANQTFMNVWEKRENIRDYRKVKQYLMVSVKNLCLDYLRKKHRDYVDVIDPFIFENMVIIKEEDPSDLIEKLDKIAKIIDHDSYQMIVYKYVYNLKHREIAEVMNVTTSVVSNKIDRALKKIKKELKA